MSPLRERLSSAAAAIAVQAGLCALLAFSFTVVRQLVPERETILFLPPLSRPQAPSQPVVIDARGRTRAPAAAPPRNLPAPAWALPSFSLGAPQGASSPLAGRYPGPDCRIENYWRLNADARKACPPPEALAGRNPGAAPLVPDRPVKNAPIWQAEVDRRNAPAALPGAAQGLIGLLGTLLFNPGAYLDKRSYSYAAPPAPPLDGAETTHMAWSQIPQCAPALDDTTRRNCAINTGAVHMLSSAGAYPGGAHVSDAVFQQALAAVQARRQSLYAPPVLASGAKTGGGDEKNGSSGGAGADGGGDGPAIPGPGR